MGKKDFMDELILKKAKIFSVFYSINKWYYKNYFWTACSMALKVKVKKHNW
jgi:hypothetical protein